jgi:hypothetical protein
MNMPWGKEQINLNKTFSFINKPIDIELYKLMALSSVNNFDVFTENQLKLLSYLEQYDNLIIKKERQSGESTLTSIHLAVKAIESKCNILILASTKRIANDILNLIKRYYASINQVFTVINNDKIILPNESIIECDSCNPSVFRARTINILHITEAAYVIDLQNCLQSIYPMSKNLKIIISSSNTDLNYFNTLYLDSINNLNNYKSFELLYSDNPGNR